MGKKTQYYTATSIDGFIADEHNSLSWLFEVPAGDDDVGHEDRFAGFFADVGAMAMGSTTYEWVLEHDQLLEHPEKWGGYYGDTPCWVFTHRELPAIPGADLRFVEARWHGSTLRWSRPQAARTSGSWEAGSWWDSSPMWVSSMRSSSASHRSRSVQVRHCCLGVCSRRT